MTEIEELYLQYYTSVSGKMMDAKAPFGIMTDKLLTQFKLMGFTNEEKAKALADVYIQQTSAINSEANRAATQLLKQADDTELSNARVDTEVRKARGYDDSLMVEILKAQSGLASFAVNANSDSAQSTIDDLHEVMDQIEARVCDYNCDIPMFEEDITSDYLTPINGSVYGSTGLTFEVTQIPELGTLTVDAEGAYIYTPQADVDGIGKFNGIITATDTANGLATATLLNISVTDIPTP